MLLVAYEERMEHRGKHDANDRHVAEIGAQRTLAAPDHC
jgi:hypothetical protein